MKIRSSAMLPAIVMIVAVLALITSVLRIWQINRWNDTLHESYVQSAGVSSNYELPAPADASDRTFELKHDIKYYDAPNGSVVKTVSAGSYLHPESKSTPLCYGWVSKPTQDKGWRLAVPFATADAIDQNEYYVRLDDLRTAVTDALGDSAKDDLDVTFTSLDAKEIARTFTRAEYETLRLDFYDYEHGRGESCPPDLDAPIWTSQVLFGLIAGVLLIAWGTVLFIVRGREMKKEEQS